MRKSYILYIVAIVFILSLVFIENNTYSLSYSSNVGIGFTFNPTLSVSLSSSDLVIDDLVPGSVEDSNVIDVSVATNAAYGYTLSATVGDSTHNNSNLTHSNNIDIEESELQLIDIRDSKVYWVAKLKDGNCWMTQNLDLDLSSSVALTSETSGIDPESYGTTIYTEETGYSRDETTGIVSWLPSTIDENGAQRADTVDIVWSNNTSATVPGWSNDNYRPYSADAGDRYRYTDTSGNETVYTSFNACLTDTDNKVGCQHMHIGNYYNWPVSIASNNIETISSPGNQKNSICPKNWDLPTGEEYSTMLQKQEVWAGSNAEYTADGYLKIRTSLLYFIRSGSITSNSTLSGLGNVSYYWTNTSRYGTDSVYMRFFSFRIDPAYDSNANKSSGFSIRCLAR